MKLKSLLSEDFSVMKKITFSTNLFKEHLKNIENDVAQKYPYIVDFYHFFYKNSVRSVCNRTFEHADIVTEHYSFSFKGFNDKGYAIFETIYKNNIRQFLINEDLGESFFYPVLNDIPEMRFHFHNDKSVISFLQIEDAYIAIDKTKKYMTTSFTKKIKLRDGTVREQKQNINKFQDLIDIVIQVKEDSDYSYIRQMEFVNDKIKSFTTSQKYRDLFKDKPIAKVAFKRKSTSTKKTMAIYTIIDGKFDFLLGEEKNNYRDAEDLGVNILNPFTLTVDDIDLFELNFLC